MTFFGATLIAAIATVVLAVFAVVTAWYARKAFREQAREVAAIERQVADQRKAYKALTEGRRRSQAARVSAWIAHADEDHWIARVKNDSDLPVFDVRARFYKIQKLEHLFNGSGWELIDQEQAPRDETICVFPPRETRQTAVPDKVISMFDDIPLSDRTCVVSLEFTDAAGNRWERDPRGALNPRS